MDNWITVNDVGPRDGIQNLDVILEPEQRLALIQALIDAGVSSIEAGSFVSERAVPAMAGTDQVFASLAGNSSARFSALAPTMKYYQQARNAGVEVLSVFICASETMNAKNIRATIAESMANARNIASQAKTDRVELWGCIAVAWECPFEGKTDPATVHRMVEEYFDMGCQGVSIADTIGAANPFSVSRLMRSLVGQYGHENLSCHFHDTRAMGLANVYAAVEAGIRNFDASVGGLGGCPFAPGATGNVATEDLVMMLHQMGFETGINLEKLMLAGQLAGRLTGTCTGGRADKWRRLQLEKGKSLT